MVADTLDPNLVVDSFGILTAAFGGHPACAALRYSRMVVVGNARRIIREIGKLMAIGRRV
jgi:hypothetical protein